MGYPGRDRHPDTWSRRGSQAMTWRHSREGAEHQKAIESRWLYLISSINHLGREILICREQRMKRWALHSKQSSGTINRGKVIHSKRWSAKGSPAFETWLETPPPQSLPWLMSIGLRTRLWFLKASRHILPLRMVPQRNTLLCLTGQKEYTMELDKFGFKLGLHHHRTLGNSVLSSSVFFTRQWSVFEVRV